MKFIQYSMMSVFAICAFCCTSVLGEVYTVSNQDAFERLARAEFKPGDKILFKRGETFSGSFAPSGNGTEQAPIRIDVYGEGARPLIKAGGQHKAGLYLNSPSYWEVNGLKITNNDGTDKDQGELFGIYILADKKEGTYEHVYINDCTIHDVNGKVAGKKRGGIHVHMKGLKQSKFHDLRITNNRIVNIGGVGIGNYSSCGKVEFRPDDTVGHHLWTKVYVAGNFVDHTGRNAIIARTSKNAVYERNVVANSSRYSTGHSIFCFNTDGIKIQYNEAYGNVGEGGKDRGGFDADYNCVNTYIQYNYSHDNLWFCGIMKRRQRNVVIRYNLSVNDREGIYFYGFESAKQARNIHIYNNTHYVRKGLHVRVFPEGRTPLNSRFENNIFYFEGEGQWGKHAKGVNTTFKNNLYFNITPHPTDLNAVTVDPLFIKAGEAPTGINLKMMKLLRGYGVRGSSACVRGGRVIQNNGGIDLLGRKLRVVENGIGAIMAVPVPFGDERPNDLPAPSSN